MFLLRLLLISFSFCYIYGSQSSEELKEILANPIGAHLMKKAIAEAYNNNKLNALTDLINNLKNDIENMTFVGTQNIYGPNGDIIEIRTVELHLPSVNEKTNLPSLTESKEDQDDDDFSLTSMKNVFDLVSLLGFELNIEGREFDSHGQMTDRMFINKDTTYQLEENVQLINKTINVDSLSDVENDVLALKKNSSHVSVHKYDNQHKLLVDKSDILPEVSSNIHAAEGNYTQELLDGILKIVTISLLDYDGVDGDATLKKIVADLTKKYPEFNFYVFAQEPTAWWLAEQDYIKITVEHDLAFFYREESDIYNIFITKKA